VELGPEINGLRVVNAGLAPSDIIVVNGLQHVRPGQTVTPTRVAMSEQSAGLTQVAAAPHAVSADAASGSPRSPSTPLKRPIKAAKELP
jgi:multidrug efflux system membrane fusion protein